MPISAIWTRLLAGLILLPTLAFLTALAPAVSAAYAYGVVVVLLGALSLLCARAVMVERRQVAHNPIPARTQRRS